MSEKHFLTVGSEGQSGVNVSFVCESSSDAPCRKRPLDMERFSDGESWSEAEPMDAGGHECWAEGLFEYLGTDAIISSAELLAEIPVSLDDATGDGAFYVSLLRDQESQVHDA